jgi:hypothetical protein
MQTQMQMQMQTQTRPYDDLPVFNAAAALSRGTVAVCLGSRGCGKTQLARHLAQRCAAADVGCAESASVVVADSRVYAHGELRGYYSSKRERVTIITAAHPLQIAGHADAIDIVFVLWGEYSPTFLSALEPFLHETDIGSSVFETLRAPYESVVIDVRAQRVLRYSFTLPPPLNKAPAPQWSWSWSWSWTWTLFRALPAWPWLAKTKRCGAMQIAAFVAEVSTVLFLCEVARAPLGPAALLLVKCAARHRLLL